MSFIRPEAADALRRYGEPAAWTAAAAAGLWYGFGLLASGAWVGVVPALLGLVAALGVFNAVERAVVAWRGRRPGPGVVSVHEGRISYFGPVGGAILALDALVRVEIVTTAAGPAEHDLYWVLTDETGQRAEIPGGAEGTERLLDRLGSLPGFDHVAVIGAMGSAGEARFRIWSRGPDAPPLPRLRER